ncbi:MAG: helix-turn-helix domain-containing protein [Actinomycetota bacterium]|nr:helix-turn-helix domain-containing protein [Actinomycetota bacterium]
MEPQLLTAEEVAEVLGIGRTRVYELLYAGELRSVKIGRLRRVPVDSLREYISSLVEAAA